METKVSIVITAMNSESTLARCLDSILNQTENRLEIIVIFSDSDDDTPYIIKEYQKKISEEYPTIDFRYERLRGGQGSRASARNRGADLVTSPYFMFVDSDDYIEPTMCDDMHKEAMKSYNDIVVCDGYLYNEEISYKEKVKFFTEFNKQSITKNYIISSYKPFAKLYRTEFWKKNHFRFLEFITYEDLALIPSLAAYAIKIKYMPEHYYNYRRRNFMRKSEEEYKATSKSIFTALAAMESEFNKAHNYMSYKEEIEFLYLKHLLYESSMLYFKTSDYKDELDRMVEVIKRKFPDFRTNIYFVTQNKTFRKVCKLIYKKRYNRAKKILGIQEESLNV